jgi:WD40 repeat protein
MSDWPYLTAEAVDSLGKVQARGFSDGHIEVTVSLTTPPTLSRLYFHRLPVLGLSFAPRTPLLASASADPSLSFWEPRPRKWKRIRTLALPAAPSSVSFSTSTVAVGLTNGEIHLFGITDDTTHIIRTDVPGAVRAAFLPSSATLFAGTADGSVQRFEPATGRIPLALGPIRVIAIAADGTIGAVGEAAAVVLDGALQPQSAPLELAPGFGPVACRWEPVTQALTVVGRSATARWAKFPGGDWRPFA